MSEKIVNLRTGNAVLAPGEVSEKAVAECEKLLEAIRSGEIQGFVAFMVHGDGTVSYTDNDLEPNFKIVGKMLQVTNWMAQQAGNR